MKIKIYSILFLSIISCGSPKAIEGIYEIDKKPTSFSIILKLNRDKKFHFESISTIGSGTTEGYWVRKNNYISLIADDSKKEKVKWGDSLVMIEKYRPFSDTLTIKIKGDKFYFIKNGILNKNFFLVKVSEEKSNLLHEDSHKN